MKAFITGGGGFIGSALGYELIRQGFSVTSFSRNDYPYLREKGIDVKKGDISDSDSVLRACEHKDIIFHVAARAGTAGHYRDYYRTNVTGTANIIQACKMNRIKYLIYTSSASVVFNGKNIGGADESLPIPSRPLSYYTATKAIAEQMILQANSPTLSTISLRPHLVYGPGDNHLIPEIISKAANGRLYRIGKCRNLVDVTYIDNAVTAHINAAQAIINNPDATGKAYFITNGEPVLLWDFLDIILQSSGLEPLKKRVPVWTATIISHVAEVFHRIFMNDQETLTPFIVSELTRSHWFDISRARRLLDYEPVISNIEGLKKMKNCFQS
ncbi:MAG TPA: 3-beta hydroxysteroid dehydrogenase [Bacteroidales bacterium]|nr:3-beta hydroxysteroid dehydrogenase [Bacteroidales bacterium]